MIVKYGWLTDIKCSRNHLLIQKLDTSKDSASIQQVFSKKQRTFLHLNLSISRLYISSHGRTNDYGREREFRNLQATIDTA